MNKTSIEWTHRPETRGAAGGMTWNLIRARIKDSALAEMQAHGEKLPARNTGTFCTRISPGCQHCYASTINKRFGNGLEFTVPNLEKVEFFVDERILAEPLKQKKPCTIFAGDMNDIFHEAIPRAMIRRVIEVACECDWHTFQFLTKRADIMWEFFQAFWGTLNFRHHIWLGVSVEDQQRADERIPLLLQTPAAVRFLSVEPQLEAINLRRFLAPINCDKCDGWAEDRNGNACDKCGGTGEQELISWVICGGESGPGARPFNLAWAESILAQCRAAGVPFFMKQIGSNATYNEGPYPLRDKTRADDRKGGDPSEWPESLRVRKFPTVSVREEVTA